MASKKLLEMLNEAISLELQVSVQYMWQHVAAKGIHGKVAGSVFKQVGIVEMKHAEEIAERLVYLGGTPTTKPAPIKVGKGVVDMLKIDKKNEEDAIKFYREIAALAEKEGDIVTTDMFRSIIADEEDHHNQFTSLLEG